MQKRILFINQEVTPYMEDSQMATAGQQQSEHVQENGYELRTFMPKWGTINERRGQLHEVIRLSGLNINIGGLDHPLLIKVASIPVSRVQVYFIDNDEYFSRRSTVADEDGNEYADNGERAIFFARGVLETVKKLRWAPEVIVCQGWMAALVPLFIKTLFADEPCFAEAKIVTSFFDEQLKQPLAPNFKSCLNYREVTEDIIAPYADTFDALELAKIAIDNSDAVSFASDDVDPRIAEYAKAKGVTILEDKGIDTHLTYINSVTNK